MKHEERIQKEFGRQAVAMSESPVFNNRQALDRLVHACELSRRMRVLDVGCGPGIVSAELARQAGQVIGIDITPEMLDQARRRCAEAQLSNVEFLAGPADRLPFEDRSFDVVVSRLTLHHVAQPSMVLREMARVAKPDGRVVLSDIVCSEQVAEADLQNALEVLRDPSHVRMLAGSVLRSLVQAQALTIQSEQTWDIPREAQEWLAIAADPQRAGALLTLLRTLAEAEVKAGMGLCRDGQTVRFFHRHVLMVLKPL